MATRRYKRLAQDDFYAAFNKVRDAFLAAKDGHEVDQVIDALLTTDEKIKIGRRVLVAEFLRAKIQYREIADLLKIGSNTVMATANQLDTHPQGFELIFKRGEKVKKEYRERAYRKVGGSKLVHKRKEYTGFKRKDVKR